MKKPMTISVAFDSVEDAAYARMFLARVDFDNFYDRTEPHLGKDRRKERAYRMRDAIGRVERALEQAQVPSRIYDDEDA